ncbi:C1GALT1-specific chaperone 1 [Osmia lignaria lignaria]|uniref:C1GALT1-specific chaperone 1 n=1 Tax=Osmia lignaria lignaria TaxID=1437193 RepID=UPI00402B2208
MHLYRFKSRSVFLVGFGIGILSALLLLTVQHVFNNMSIYERSFMNSYTANKNDLSKWFTSVTPTSQEITFQLWEEKKVKDRFANVTYRKWLENQQVKIKDIDMDTYLYGIKGKERLEADWLKSNVHLTCIVFVKKIKLARSVKDTWGKHCNKIYFFGQQKDSEVPVRNFDRKLVSSWQLLCEAFNYVWKDNATLEWLVFVKDDTLVIPENLRYMLGPLNYTDDYYLGHAVVMWGQSYNAADAGYVISKGVLKKLTTMFDNSEKCITGGKYWKQEDYYLAKHLATMGIHPSDTRDQYLRGTFHGYSLQSLLWGVAKIGIYWTRALYPAHDECCSFMSVTFNVAESDKMYTLNYLLYHLHVFKNEAIFGTRNAPVSVPDENVWKVALKEEFNITYLNNISSDAYYEIWHSKYSEPGQLIAQNYHGRN